MATIYVPGEFIDKGSSAFHRPSTSSRSALNFEEKTLCGADSNGDCVERIYRSAGATYNLVNKIDCVPVTFATVSLRVTAKQGDGRITAADIETMIGYLRNQFNLGGLPPTVYRGIDNYVMP